jgi:hypothetical protein
MKKFIAVICLWFLFSSCDDSIRSHALSENSSVEISFHDSTKWKPAEIMIPYDNKMYVRSGDEVYKMYGIAAADYILVLIIGLLIGMLIGFKLTND